MLKHLPAKSLKAIENDLLYSKEEVVIPYVLGRRVSGTIVDGNNRIIHNVTRSDKNFRDGEKFRNQLKDKYVYKIPFKYICDIGKINFPTKIDMKIRLTLETDMKNLFESEKIILRLKMAKIQILLILVTLSQILRLQRLTCKLYY